MSFAMSINFILPISGMFDTLEADVILVTALIGLFERGPVFYSLILSN
jgi:hypothetical protein